MMDECCAETPSEDPGESTCPVDGSPGEVVRDLTVAAQVVGPLPPRQSFRLCRDPHCEVVYFGSAGARLTRNQVHTVPGFKAGESGLVCYCFGYSASDISGDIRSNGRSTILQRVKERVEAGECFCEVKNPSGRCCLGELKALATSSERRGSEASMEGDS